MEFVRAESMVPEAFGNAPRGRKTGGKGWFRDGHEMNRLDARLREKIKDSIESVR